MEGKTDSYAVSQQLNRTIANESTPSATGTISAIQSLLTLKKANADNDAAMAGINSLLQSEIRYLNSAAQMLARQDGGGQLLRQRFGEGLLAASGLANVLKQRQSNRVADQILDRLMDNTNGTRLTDNDTYSVFVNAGQNRVREESWRKLILSLKLRSRQEIINSFY